MTGKFLLELKDVGKTYQDPSGVKVTAVKDISLKLKEGSLTMIIGPSGSGKSTLLKIAGMIQRPSQGSVIFKDQETKNLHPDERASLIKENVAFIFKNINLLSYLNILENVMLPMSDPDQVKALKILNRLGLKDPSICPEKLSSFEKQKVALARAMINKPSLILLDEPTGCLRSNDALEYLDILSSLKKSFSFLLVTDNQQMAAQADEVYYMQSGILKE